MEKLRGLLVIGTQRSGSNLLRLMLNQLPDVVALHPPHILQIFYPLLSSYGDLGDKNIFETLVDDVCSFVELNPASWEEITLNRKTIASRCQRPELLEIYRAIHETAAEFHKKSVWCCKSMANVSYIPQIEEFGLKPTYLHLYRDGRDVALSFKKAIVGEKHIYHLAKQWVKDQNEALTYTARYASERTISVKYENLISNPEKEIKDICRQLQVEYSAEALQYHSSEEAHSIAKAGDMWKNVTKPVLTDNHNKFLKEMPESELMIFEAVAGATLEQLGYQRCIEKSKLPTGFSTQEIQGFDAENKILKESFKKKVSPEDLEKRRGQEELVSKIKARRTIQN